jgi:plasma-membrane proton-efflux P-type ATPase
MDNQPSARTAHHLGDDGQLKPLSAAQAAQELQTDPATGLNQAQVTERLRQHGYNEVVERKAHPLRTFAGKFWGLSAWMLELIIVLSWILHKTSDAYIVTALLIVNAILGFTQEQRAAGAVEALRQRLQIQARVLRDAAWQTLSARELVPGDVLRVRMGDLVPADVMLWSGELSVDQSALTGESVAVDRQRDDLIFSGSVVRHGEATGMVTHTGAHTYLGRAVELVQLARPKLHVEALVTRVVQGLLWVVGVLLAVALVASALRGQALLDILPLMLVLLLGAIPVALPVMFTVSMAFGAMELARKGVLVTRLSASEDAASMDVLCVDKTGTLTQNQLTLVEVFPAQGRAAWEPVLYGALASQEANHDPIDLAFLAAARDLASAERAFEQVAFTPFDPATRRTEARVRGQGQEFRVLKGAVNVIAAECALGPAQLAAWDARTQAEAQRGHRALAVAQAELVGPPHMVGVVTLADPPRPDSKQWIAELAKLGVAVKMLTGDALPIAQDVARQVGLGDQVHLAGELRQLAETDPMQAARLVERGAGFAEVYPADKYAVVKSLQAAGHVVGMTGDGVNDAPALRQAEVGIAVRNATDAANGAASVVLTDEGLLDIVTLVQNGRRINQRITTWIINKISRTVLKSAFVVLAYLLTGKYVISSFAMMLSIFMTDFVKITLSTDNVRWSQTPEKWDVPRLARIAAVLGSVMVVEAMSLLWIGLRYLHLGANEPLLHTFCFEILLFFALFSVFVVRERGHFWDSRPSRALFIAVLLDGLAAVGMTSVGIPGLSAIPLPYTLLVLAYACVFSLWVNDGIKYELVKRAGLGW